MQTKAWMTSFLFKEFLSFFKKLILGEIFSIIEEHGSHVMLEAIAQAQEFNLDMVTSLTHTFHAITTPRCKFFQAIQNYF